MKQKVVEGGSQSISETKGTSSLGGQLLSNGKHENEEQKALRTKTWLSCVSVRLTLEFNTIKSYLNMFLDDKEC